MPPHLFHENALFEGISSPACEKSMFSRLESPMCMRKSLAVRFALLAKRWEGRQDHEAFVSQAALIFTA